VGPPGWAEVEVARPIAAANTEVTTASTSYVLRMKSGFRVTGDQPGSSVLGGPSGPKYLKNVDATTT
jgi:hypothetical protein